jgi:putative FmdB family regulatory protein
MPTYDAKCTVCAWEHEFVSTIDNRNTVPICPKCGGSSERFISLAPYVRPDLNDFSTENGGKGRFNKQLMTHVTSVDDAIGKAHKRGFEVLDRA